MINECVTQTAVGVVLTIHVQPRTAKTEYIGLYGETALKFRVAAPPVGGEANEALCQFLARHCGLSKSAVVMTGGAGSRHKRVLLKGISLERVKQVVGFG